MRHPRGDVEGGGVCGGISIKTDQSQFSIEIRIDHYPHTHIDCGCASPPHTLDDVLEAPYPRKSIANHVGLLSGIWRPVLLEHDGFKMRPCRIKPASAMTNGMQRVGR